MRAQAVCRREARGGGLAGGWRSAGYEYLAGPFQQETPLAGRDTSGETDCWRQLAGQIGGVADVQVG